MLISYILISYILISYILARIHIFAQNYVQGDKLSRVFSGAGKRVDNKNHKYA